MHRGGRWSVIGAFMLVVLGACGGPQIAQPITPSTLPTSEAQASAPPATPVPASPTFVPSATIPPTTSPLPTLTPRQPTQTATVSAALTTTAPAAPTTPPATTVVATGEEAIIARIRERYATINQNEPQYRRVERDLAGYSTEGGTLEAFYDGAALRKIVATYYGELGRTREEYYLWEDQVFFVFRTEDFYDEPFGEVVTTEENRFYFDNNRMIRWIGKDGRFVDRASAEWSERETESQQRAQELLALLAS